MSRGFLTGWLLLLLGALVLRLPQLSQRPMHTDESVHAIKFGTLWEKGVYRYDPHEYHGPTLYYATLPVAWLSPARRFAELTETDLRLVPALFGAGLVLILPLLRRALGPPATLAAGLLTVISPASTRAGPGGAVTAANCCELSSRSQSIFSSVTAR